MKPEVRSVINAAADEADGLLEGIESPAEAKQVLLEWVTDNHPALPKAERAHVVREVLSLLEEEGFFENSGRAMQRTNDDRDFGEADE